MNLMIVEIRGNTRVAQAAGSVTHSMGNDLLNQNCLTLNDEVVKYYSIPSYYVSNKKVIKNRYYNK